MRGFYSCTIIVLVLCLLPGCIKLPDVALWGRVDLNAPVDGTTIAVVKAATGEAVWEGAVSDGLYLTRLPSGGTALFGAALKLTVTGGTVDGVPFDGTLETYVPSYLPGDHLETDIITTLVARYMETHGVGAIAATEAVLDYLGLPRDTSFINRAHQGISLDQFDPALFMAEAAARGGFDAYVNELVTNEIGTATPRRFSALYRVGSNGLVGAAGVGGMGINVGGSLVNGVLSGIGSFAANEALGWILSAFGYEDSEAQNFEAILNTLDEMNAKLDTLIAQGVAIEEQLNAVLAAVQLGDDEIIQEINGSLIAGPQNIIDNQFQNLYSAFPPSSTSAHTPSGQTLAMSTAHDFLDAGKYDIDQQLYNLHSGIMGLSTGTTGFLDSCTNVLIDKAAGGQDLLSCYLVLENYYAKLFAIQGKGLVLMSEALHIVNGDLTPSSTKTFSGTVADYCNKYNASMEAQLGKFMSCVDRLLASKVDVRTDLASPVQLLPSEAGSIYARVDFLANQVSPNQPAGLVARIIGTPSAVAAALQAGVTAVDQRIVVSTYSGGPNRVTTTTTYPFTTVKVNGAETDLSTPAFPSHSTDATIKPDKYYLEWTGTTASGFKYNLQNKVAVAKLVMGAGSPVIRTDTCGSCAVGGALSWSVNPGLQGATAGSINYNIKTYDSTYSLATSGTSYGSLVFTARVNPNAWSTGTAWKTSQGSNTISLSFDPSSMRFAELVTATQYTTHRTCSSAGGYPVCQDYWDFNFDVTGLFKMDMTPLSAADEATIGVNAKLKVGLANGIKNVLSSYAIWDTALGSAVSAPDVKSAGTYSSTPADATPTTSVNMNMKNDDSASTYVPTVKFTYPSTATATLKLQHRIQVSSEFTSSTTQLPTDAHAAYTKLELFPVP